MNFHEITNVIIIDAAGKHRIVKPGMLLADYREYLYANDMFAGSDEQDWADAVNTNWFECGNNAVLTVNTAGVIKQL